MKNSEKCPKCQSKDIIRVEGYSSPNCFGNSIRTGGILFGRFIQVPRYVCCRCGYTEEWVDKEDLPQIRENAQ